MYSVIISQFVLLATRSDGSGTCAASGHLAAVLACSAAASVLLDANHGSAAWLLSDIKCNVLAEYLLCMYDMLLLQQQYWANTIHVSPFFEIGSGLRLTHGRTFFNVRTHIILYILFTPCLLAWHILLTYCIRSWAIQDTRPDSCTPVR